MRLMVAGLVLAFGCRTRLPERVVSDDAGPPHPERDLATTVDLADDLAARVDLAVGVSGCADGTREGFTDEEAWPRIAGCAGGFRIPGVLSATLAPACGRAAGNASANPEGDGCNVSDLCAIGWHVCASAADVLAHNPGGCVGATGAAELFFVSRQSSNGCSVCAVGQNPMDPPCDGASCVAGCRQSDATANDVFGCGTAGDAPLTDTCRPLDRFGNNLCQALPGSWSCGSDGITEARNLVHLSSAGGGALCCAD